MDFRNDTLALWNKNAEANISYHFDASISYSLIILKCFLSNMKVLLSGNLKIMGNIYKEKMIYELSSHELLKHLFIYMYKWTVKN